MLRVSTAIGGTYLDGWEAIRGHLRSRGLDRTVDRLIAYVSSARLPVVTCPYSRRVSSSTDLLDSWLAKIAPTSGAEWSGQTLGNSSKTNPKNSDFSSKKGPFFVKKRPKNGGVTPPPKIMEMGVGGRDGSGLLWSPPMAQGPMSSSKGPGSPAGKS